jgi:hypothetical protein
MDPRPYADFRWCKSQLPWLKSRTIFLCLSGSHAYGTATPESDVDLRGIAADISSQS